MKPPTRVKSGEKMSDSFTAVEYAVLVHLKTEGRCTIPDMCADLLLRPTEVETALSDLINKSFVQREGDFYSPGNFSLDIPAFQTKKSGTGRMGRPLAFPAPAAMPSPSMPDVDNVFKQARERAKREKAGGL